jgi:hypothetical protein
MVLEELSDPSESRKELDGGTLRLCFSLDLVLGSPLVLVVSSSSLLVDLDLDLVEPVSRL